MAKFENAIFGNIGGSHQLLETSLTGENDLLEQLRFLVDRPVGHVGPEVLWSPYWGCTPIGNWWALWCGVEDHNAPRKNMVTSRVALLKKESVGSTDTLDDLLEYLSFNGLKVDNSMVGSIVDALISGTQPVIVPKISLAPSIISQLWNILWPAARYQLSLRTLFGNELVESEHSPQIVIIPSELSPRWRTHSNIDSIKKHSSSEIAFWLLGKTNPVIERLFQTNRDQLPGELTILSRLERIAKEVVMLSEGSGNISNALLIARTIDASEGTITLDEESKAIVSEVLCNMQEATIADIRTISLAHLRGLNDIIPRVEEETSRWIVEKLSNETDHDALWIIKNQTSNAHAKWWLKAIRKGLSEAIKYLTPEWAKALWRWWALDPNSIDWILSNFTTAFKNEKLLLSYAPEKVSPELQTRLINLCSKCQWAKLLAHILNSEKSLETAVTILRKTVNHPENGVEILIQNRAEKEVIAFAASDGWEPIVDQALKMTNHDPSLFDSFDLTTRGLMNFLATHLAKGGALPHTATSNDFVLRIFEKCVAGDNACIGVIPYLGVYGAKAAVRYHQEDKLWNTLGATRCEALLAKTATAWLEVFIAGEQVTKPGATLSQAIRNLARDFLRKGTAQTMIGYLRIFHEVSESEVIKWLSEEGFSWQAGDAESLAELLLERKWANAAKSFKYSWKMELKDVAWHARELLNFWDRPWFSPHGINGEIRNLSPLQKAGSNNEQPVISANTINIFQTNKTGAIPMHFSTPNCNATDLSIVVALEEEFNQLYEFLGNELQAIKDEEHGGYDYECLLQFGDGPEYSCVVHLIGAMGPDNAGRKAERIFSKWKPTSVVMLGIAGSLDRDIKLGDIVVANQIDSYASNLKATDDEAGGFKYIHRGSFQPTDHEYLQQIKDFPFANRNHYQTWKDCCANEICTILAPEQESQLKVEGLLREHPKIYRGHLASGPVVGTSAKYRDWLHQRDSTLKALEMEAAGLAAAAHQRKQPIRTMVIRGISDFADDRKSDLDAIGSGGIRKYAMRNTIRLLFKFIELGVFQSDSTTKFMAKNT